ncbi:MAG: hypothetical protein M3Y03_03270 [Verrucomicrobiota bacterium]|nr:hypothetical protein [Verrucomicrobiota bacterium]
MLPFRSGRSRKLGAIAACFSCVALSWAASAGQQKKKPSTKAEKTETGKKKGPLAGEGIPLPVGHEVKGLVFPDYNSQGKLQAKFEAAVARRLDAERVQFEGLKVITFTPENTQDLSIDMPTSVLDLNTRIVTSQSRTTIRRPDLEIAGDTLSFDTAARHGTLTGNVKMVITNSSRYVEKPSK